MLLVQHNSKLTPLLRVYEYIIPKNSTWATTLHLYNSPVDCARELFKPSNYSASLQVRNEKNFGFGFRVFGEWCHKWAVAHLAWRGVCHRSATFHITYQHKTTFFLNTLMSGRNRGFSRKKHQNARGFAPEFLRSGQLNRPGKRLKDAASLLVCTRKKIFAWRLQIFCEWHHKWKTFRPPWPTLPGPGCQSLDGSILLKFLLETRLQTESFDTLDDLLGFWVQKLWSKVIKIFD